MGLEKYIVSWGLSGGFGGISEWEIITVDSLEEASGYAYEQAIQEFESMVGLYGLRDIEDIMEEDEVDEEEATQIFLDEREDWLEYKAIKWTAKLEEEYCDGNYQ